MDSCPLREETRRPPGSAGRSAHRPADALPALLSLSRVYFVDQLGAASSAKPSRSPQAASISSSPGACCDFDVPLGVPSSVSLSDLE
ncbi:hypothetical protein PAL_GLEAN10010449 [Pteropus alecto]|uniref:Uncharacterized protein n=1 Tax=Pteropus alecto TaxID=9402 RepID=L5KM97_PTEAL|nr:hypothetical protein PAL_GLEAN10010449 [Pteropus alecto]